MDDNQSLQHVETEIDRQVEGPAARFLDRLAQRLGGRASWSAVYGEPVERDGITVIPVAKVGWGFGGGAGRGSNSEAQGNGEGSGEGGGGGASVTPVGYIEIAGGKAEFRRIKDPGALLPLAPLIMAVGMSVMLILRGVARIRRA